MKLPRDASGQDVVKALCCSWGFRVVHQVGSHIILQTDKPNLPDHRPVRPYTLHAIIWDVARHRSVVRLEVIATLRLSSRLGRG